MIVTKADNVDVGKESLYEVNIHDEYSLLEASSSINKQVDKISVYVQGVEALDYMSRYVSDSMDNKTPIVTDHINNSMEYLTELTGISSDEYILDGTESLSSVMSHVTKFIHGMFTGIIDMISKLINYIVTLVKKVIEYILGLFGNDKSSGGGGSSGRRPTAKEKVEKAIEDVDKEITKNRDNYDKDPHRYKKVAEESSVTLVDRIHKVLEDLPIGVATGVFSKHISIESLSEYTGHLRNSYDDIYNTIIRAKEYRLISISRANTSSGRGGTLATILEEQMNNLIDNVSDPDEISRKTKMLFHMPQSDMQQLFNKTLNVIESPSLNNASVKFFDIIKNKYSEILDGYHGTIIGFTNKNIVLRTYNETEIETARALYISTINEIYASMPEDSETDINEITFTKKYMSAVANIAKATKSNIIKVPIPVDKDITKAIKKISPEVTKLKPFIGNLTSDLSHIFEHEKVAKDMDKLNEMYIDLEGMLNTEKAVLLNIKTKFDSVSDKITDEVNVGNFNTVITTYGNIISKEITDSVSNIKDLVFTTKDVLKEISTDTSHKQAISKLRDYLIDYQTLNIVIDH